MTVRALMTAIAVAACGGCDRGDGLDKQPVTGSVRINGKPEPLVAVQFWYAGPTPPGRNAGSPVGVTGPDGTFHLSTNGDKDGAVAGEYAVTFVWLSGNSPTASDRFGGAFEKRDGSTRRVTVNPGPNLLPPFDLTFNEPKRTARPKANDIPE